MFVRNIILLLIVTTPWFNIDAQVTVTGKINSEQGESIPGANIYIQGTYDGTSSDLEGNFSFKTYKADTLTLIASFIGYHEYQETILPEEDSIFVEIVLAEIINRLSEIVITAGSFEAGGESKSEVLRPLDIVTTAGATADIAAALNTLPGTQTVGEEGRLFVRGGASHETKTFIDGIAVQESYDITAPNLPTRNRFSPFMFGGTSFSTGGYSAEYGQGLSSTLVLNTKELAIETRTDLSFITVGLEAAHTHAWEAASLAGKIGYFNLDPYYKIINQDFDWTNAPTSIDGNLAFRAKVGDNGMFKSYGKFNFSGMRFNYDSYTDDAGLTDIDLSNQYGYLNTSFRTAPSEKWLLQTGVSYTHSNDDILLDEDIVQQKSQGFHVKGVAGYEYNDRVFLKFGGELFTVDHFEDFLEFETNFQNRFEFSERIVANFIEAKLFLSDSFLTRIGFRSEYNSLNKKMAVDPRISFALKTGENSQFSAAFGHFRQSVPKELLRVSNELGSEEATHYILNYQYIKRDRTFRIEAYWKEYNDLVSFDPENIFLPDAYNNSGEGNAKGFDLFFRDSRSINNVDYWISYSFLDTERIYRDFPSSAAPSFTSKHNFSVVYKHFIPDMRSQVGLTYSFASGRPYNDPNQSEFNGERSPSYHDVSANVSYLPKNNIIIYASITNLLKRNHVFGYDYRSEPNDQGIFERRPRMLPAPRFLLLGLFLTFTKSNTINQLPNL